MSDVAGVAAIEFAYIVPLLILMTFGTLEVGRAVMAHKRFQRATAMVGDLVAREQQLANTAADAQGALAGIMNAAETAMKPYDYTPFKMAIYQIRANTANATQTTVEWSYSHNMSGVKSCPQNKAMPANGMIAAGNAAILVESEYQYTPLMGNVLKNVLAAFQSPMTFKDTMSFAPRNGSVVYCVECNDPAKNPNFPCPPG